MRAARTLLVVALVAGGCSVGSPPDGATGDGTATIDAVPGETATGLEAPADAVWASTTAADGNRYLAGAWTGTVQGPWTAPVAFPPSWVVGVSLADGGVGVVVTGEAGDAQAFTVDVGGVTETASGGLGTAPTGRPALVAVDGVWRFPDVGATNGQPPVPVADGVLAWVDGDGRVRLDGEPLDAQGDLPVLPDTRVAASADGRPAWLTQPTTIYGHGVLGDALEASSVTSAEPGGALASEQFGPDTVIEGIGPIWADVDDDGRQDLVLTVSRDGDGAGVLASVAGRALRGPVIGATGRWRHLIAVVPGPARDDGEPTTEIVEVVTPHLTRTASWLRVDEDALTQVATVDRALVSHTIGSRNLDQAVAVDVTGDGIPELLGPSLDGAGLAVVQRPGTNGAQDGGVNDLAGPTILSNVTALAAPDGSLVVAAAGSDVDGAPVVAVWRWAAS